MDKIITAVLAVSTIAVSVMLWSEIIINQKQRATISALAHGYEKCRHYNAVVDCNLAGFNNCEEKVKKMEEQARGFVRWLDAK